MAKMYKLKEKHPENSCKATVSINDTVRILSLKERETIAEEFTIRDVPLACFFIEEMKEIVAADLGKYYKLASKSRFGELIKLIDIRPEAADRITIDQLIEAISDHYYEQGVDYEIMLRIFHLLFYHFIYYPCADCSDGIKLKPKGSYYIISNFVRIEFMTFIRALEALNDIDGEENRTLRKSYYAITRKLGLISSNNKPIDIGTVLYAAYDTISKVMKKTEDMEMNPFYSDEKQYQILGPCFDISELVFKTIFQS